ncbi:MAG: AraC family transcriptional regulator [Kiritimatiellae bacterium]|nr:AraC family transcriptional regulator [Kiritimatiellia bacterium]
MEPAVKYVRICEGWRVTGTWMDPEYVFHYIAAGTWLFRLERRLYTVRAGDVLLCRPNVLHFVKPVRGRNLRLYVAHFEWPGAPAGVRAIPEGFTVPRGERDRLCRRFLDLYREHGEQAQAASLTSSGIMLELLGLCVRSCERDAPFEQVMSKSWRNIEVALQFMRAEQARKLSIREISRRAGLSPAYFCRVFKEYAGVPPQQYLNRLRVDRARDLLRATGHNCTEIAAMAGFSSVHVFSKVFKRIEGLSPAQWARKVGPFRN